jgi:hypothetical protein
MANTSPTPSPSDSSDPGKQLELLVGLAQNMVDEEYRRTERLENRGRQTFAATGVLFAVVMATTAGILNALTKDSHVHHWVYILLGVTAAWSTLALCVALYATLEVDRTRKQDALDPKTIEQYIGPAQKGNPAVGATVANIYARQLRLRRDSNNARAADLKCARWWCGFAALATLCQLGAIFAAVIAR